MADPILDALFEKTPEVVPGERGNVSPIRGGSDPVLDALFEQDTAPSITPAGVTEPESEEEPGIISEFATGVGAGVRSLGAQFTAAGGVIADIVGAEETGRELLESAAQTQSDIQRTSPRAVEFEQAFDSPTNFLTWLSRMTGEQIPVLGSLLVGGGIGGIVGRLVGRGAISAVEGSIAIERGIALGEARGFTTGALATGAAFETGATASELFGVEGEVESGISLAAGIAKGALEVVVPLGLARVLGVGRGVATGVLAKVTESLTKIQSRTLRAGAGLASGAPVEGATELMQEAIDIGVRDYIDENFDALGPEGVARLQEAAVSGLFLGGVFGGVAGGLSSRPVDDLEVKDFDPGSAQGDVKAAEDPFAGLTPVDKRIIAEHGILEEGEVLSTREREVAGEEREFVGEPIIEPAPIQETSQSAIGLTIEDVETLIQETELSDREKLLQALGSEKAVKEFERLDRRQNSSNPQVADKAAAEFAERYESGNLSAEQDRLIFGIGEKPSLNVEELKAIRTALEATDFDPGESDATVAGEAAFAMRSIAPAAMREVKAGGGKGFEQASFIAMMRSVAELRARGFTSEQIDSLILDAMEARGFSIPDAIYVLEEFTKPAIVTKAARLPAPFIDSEGKEAPIIEEPLTTSERVQEAAIEIVKPTKKLNIQNARIIVQNFTSALGKGEGAILGSLGNNRMPDVVEQFGDIAQAETILYRGFTAGKPVITENQRAISTGDLATAQSFSLARNDFASESQILGPQGEIDEEFTNLPIAKIIIPKGARILDVNKFGGITQSEQESVIAGRLEPTGKSEILVEQLSEGLSEFKEVPIFKEIALAFEKFRESTFAISVEELESFISQTDGVDFKPEVGIAEKLGVARQLAFLPRLSQASEIQGVITALKNNLVIERATEAPIRDGTFTYEITEFRLITQSKIEKDTVTVNQAITPILQSLETSDLQRLTIAYNRDIAKTNSTESIPVEPQRDGTYWQKFDVWLIDQALAYVEGGSEKSSSFVFDPAEHGLIGGQPFKVLINPSANQMKGALKRHGELRQIVDGKTGDRLVYPAARADHQTVADALGIAIFSDEFLLDYRIKGRTIFATAGHIDEAKKQTLTKIDRAIKRFANELEKAFGPEGVRGLRDDLARESEIAGARESIGEAAANVAHEKGVEDNTDILEGMGLNPDSISHTPEATMSDTLLKEVGVSRTKRKKLRALNDRFNWIRKWGETLPQLAKENPHILRLSRQVELFRRWADEKMGIVSIADKHLRSWKATMSVEMQDRFAKFLFAMDAMEYLSEAELDAGIARWPDTNPDGTPHLDAEGKPTNIEFAAIVKKHKLSQAAVEQYQHVRGDMAMILDRMEEGSIAEANRTITDQALLNKKVNEIKFSMNNLRSRPYFPQSRFGDFALIIRSKKIVDGKRVLGKTVFFKQFESKAQAEAQKDEAQKEFPEDLGFTEVGLDKIPEQVQSFRGMPPQLLENMKVQLEKSGLMNDELSVWMDHFAAEYLPGRSFRKRLIRRKNVKGFSTNAMRSYANYMRSAAGHIARVKYNGLMDENIAAMIQEKNELLPGTDTTKRSRIIEFVSRHKKEILNPKTDWAWMRSVAFTWYLGFVPASAVLNFTQVPMVAYPYLADRFSDAKAINALKNGVLGVHRTYQNKTKNVSEFEIYALNRAMQKRFLNESMATETAGVTEGDNMAALIPGNALHKFIAQSAHWSAFLFHHSEQINRRVVFRAGVELALANPDAKYLDQKVLENQIEFEEIMAEGRSETEARAFIAGMDAVNATQHEYADWARARFMRGKRGVVFAFWMFMQNMVWFATPGRGRAGVGRYWLMMLLAAGLMGLPGADDLAAVARFISRELFGADFNIDKELRELVVAMTDDPVAADVMLHGISRIGFGIPHAMDMIGQPFPEFDFSANISMGQLVPGLQEVLGEGDFNSKFSRATTDMAGAVAGIGINAIKFLTDNELPYSDSKRWERAAPRAIKNLLKAQRFYTEGEERNRIGAPIVEFDVTDGNELAEIIAQGLGFTPLRLSRRWDRDRMQKESEMYWTTRRQMLLRQFDHAFVVDDRQANKDVRSAIHRFNNEVPFRAMGITGKQLRASRKARNRNRRLQAAGIPIRKGLRPLSQDISGLFPDEDRRGGNGDTENEIFDVEDVSRWR